MGNKYLEFVVIFESDLWSRWLFDIGRGIIINVLDNGINGDKNKDLFSDDDCISRKSGILGKERNNFGNRKD